ncbi:hypothetical protein M405DRAFT_882034 [Rhizopogon salebrosus TDB-379]|nr:hypothetical protein M405DRAFT_882034 [Rhizopogon salebrosus TDB-379]
MLLHSVWYVSPGRLATTATSSPILILIFLGQERGPMLPHCCSASTLCGIAEELRCHILSFLAFNEIIRCALTCKTMYSTVKGSSELQYTIELGAQGLMPVHPQPPTVSAVDCLRTLKDKASGWSSFELNASKKLCITSAFLFKSIAHQRLIFAVPSARGGELSFKVIDLKTCTPDAASASPGLRTWSRNSANPVPRTFICTYLDEMQDLMITVNLLGFYTDTYGFKYQINLHGRETSFGLRASYNHSGPYNWWECYCSRRSPCFLL